MKMLLNAVLMLTVHATLAQVELMNHPAVEPQSSFEVDAISFASDSAGLSRLDMFAAIPYERLSFVKNDDAFLASYEITIDIYGAKNALVNEKLWTKEIRVTSFDQSVSSSSFATEQRSVMLPPGHYQIAFLLRDLESRRTYRVNKQLDIIGYSRSGLFFSDIMLISKFAVKDGKKSITPSISANVGTIPSPFHVFFEAYNADKRDSLKFVTAIYNVKNELLQKSDTTSSLSAGRNQIFLPVDQAALPIGDYKLFVQGFSTRAAESEPSLATTSRFFIVRWAGLPTGVKDLDLAVEQLVYIAKDKELAYIKQATTAEEKQKRFFEFWKKKDPNPNTVRNEKMEQHYARVDYANKHFKHYTEGWRTDMGMVYIIFGVPSNVDRHPFDSDSKPYEIWSYYELNHSFTFVDQTGFGDYRLTTPIWDVWQRPRD
jgi:GWxTD domain-containing protein